MSDLPQRLRLTSFPCCQEAADRIEALEACTALATFNEACKRIEKLEAALAQVAELTNASKNTTCNTCRMAGVVARAALAPEPEK